jgi:hypothetical protein
VETTDINIRSLTPSGCSEAVRTVRGLSGTELPVVLAQLGAPAK